MQRRVQRHGLSFWAGGVLAAALLGVGTAVIWPRPPAEGSPEVTFARDMSAHHAQAVDMSVTMVKRAADPAVKLLAQDILLTQQAQIGQMGLASAEDERELQHLPVNTAETRYLVLMRRHHQGGVAMAKSALKTVKRPEVRAFAERVVAAQTSEIQAIDALLKKRMTGQPPAQAQPEMPEMDGMQHE